MIFSENHISMAFVKFDEEFYLMIRDLMVYGKYVNNDSNY